MSIRSPEFMSRGAARPIIDGVYVCRCSECGADYLTGLESKYLLATTSTICAVACPRCWTPTVAARVQARVEEIHRYEMSIDDPFACFKEAM